MQKSRYYRDLVLHQRIGQYRIVNRLGEGGMGEIFAAHDEKLNRTVAIKLISKSRLDDDSRRLFLQEARTAAALDHPFVCIVHDVLEHDGQPMIVMEHVDGETLQSRISRGPVPVEEAVHYALEISEALAAAHSRGVVHRDVKSANVMITASGHVKVMDFGLALIIDPSPEDVTIEFGKEGERRIAGTLPYMAPEILRGDRAAASGDLYALGVVLYEMLTARRPFSGKTSSVLIAEILDRIPAPPRQLQPLVPRPLDDLVMRLLSKNPAMRPSASEVIVALKALTSARRESSRSLAVLPFRSLTSDPENAHLGVALADATTGELALIQSLIVRPTAAILQYQDADPFNAGRDLAVDAVVTGTYQRAGSRLRVSVQLVSTHEQRPLWSTKIDTTLGDIFAMQDEVSRKIVEALEVELTSADERRFARRPNASADVLDLYIKGRVLLLHETIPDVNKAIELFERAQQIEPDNALIRIALADAYCRLAWSWDPNGGWYERAKAISDQVLELDPELPEGRYIRARLAWSPQGGYQHEHAIRELVAVLAERPNFNEGFDWLATILFHVGLIEETTAYYRHALVINPEDTLARTHLHMGELLTGNYALVGSLATFETSWAIYMAIFAHLRLGDLSTAATLLETASRKFPGAVLFMSARAVLAARRGDESAARTEIERTLQARHTYGHFHHAELDVAGAFAILGESDLAMMHLQSAVRNGFPCLNAVTSDPLLAPLRSHPAYAELIEELREQRDHFSAVFGELQRMIAR